MSGLLCKARRRGGGLVGGSGTGGVAPRPEREPSGVRVIVSTNLPYACVRLGVCLERDVQAGTQAGGAGALHCFTWNKQRGAEPSPAP